MVLEIGTGSRVRAGGASRRVGPCPERAPATWCVPCATTHPAASHIPVMVLYQDGKTGDS